MDTPHSRCLMEHTGDDEYDTRALPTTTFIKIYLEYDKPSESLNSSNRVNFHQYLHFKSTCAKILLATSKLHVSTVKCRQILKKMIVAKPRESRDYGLALNHINLYDCFSAIGEETSRSTVCSPPFELGYWYGNPESPISWLTSCSNIDLSRLETVLVGYNLSFVTRKNIVHDIEGRDFEDDGMPWNESYGKTRLEWIIMKYAKGILPPLRKLMKSLLVEEEDTALENVLELFIQSCAEVIADDIYETAMQKVRLYAACILECTISSGTYYLLDLASKCKDCEDCRLISKSHETLYTKTEKDWKAAYEEALKNSPLATYDEVVLLSHDCERLFESLKATFHRPNGPPFVSHLRIADQALKCGDIRDILKAATFLASYRHIVNGRMPSGFFVGTTFYHPGSKRSKFHEGNHRSPIDSNKMKEHIKRVILLAGDRDLITLRVDEAIFIFGVDRQGLNSTVQAAKACQGSQALDIITDGEEMTGLLKYIQVEGGSATYNNDNFGPFKKAVFTGDQALWVPPSAEDLLQAGVYTSVSRDNDEIGICNVVEQAALAEGKYSIRHQKEVVQIRKATRTCADIYQCLDERTRLTTRMATGVRIG